MRDLEAINQRALAAGEARSLSLPSRGEIEPQVYDRRKAKEGLPCESAYGCTNNADTTFVIVFGEESKEQYLEISLCKEDSEEVMFHYRERERT